MITLPASFVDDISWIKEKKKISTSQACLFYYHKGNEFYDTLGREEIQKILKESKYFYYRKGSLLKTEKYKRGTKKHYTIEIPKEIYECGRGKVKIISHYIIVGCLLTRKNESSF